MFIDKTHRSPNHSSRNTAAISLLVLHATVGSFKSSLEWLTDPGSGVSTHYLIAKDGTIDQLVPDDQAAHHAGKSTWRGLDSNQIRQQSIGIELENLTGMRMKDGSVHPFDPYPGIQIKALLELARSLVIQYRILPDMVVRHADIAIPAGRKSDPALFPWADFKYRLYEGLGLHRYTVRSLYVNVRQQPTSKSISTDKIWYSKPAWGVMVAGEEVSKDARWVQLWGRPAGFAWAGALKLAS